MNKAQRWLAKRFLGMPDAAFEVTQQRANPVAFVTTFDAIGGIEGGKVPYPFEIDKLEQVFVNSPYIYAAVNAIARDVAATPIIAERRMAEDWEKIDRPPDWFRVFENPNPDDSIEALLKDHVFALYAAGNGYFPFDNTTGPELYNIPASAINAVVNKETGVIGTYKVMRGGQEKMLDAKTVIHTRLPRVIHGVYGTPPAETMKKTLSAQFYLTDLMNSYFANGAFLNLILQYQGEMTPEEREEIKAQFERRHTGKGRGFRPALLQGGLTAQNMTTPMKDVLPTDVDELFKKVIFACFGVPPMILGDQEQKYANAEQQMQRYQQGTIEPVRRTIENAFNSQLVKVHFEKSGNIRIRFDRSEVPGLEEDLTSKTNRASTAFRSGLVTRDEGRKIMGLDPTGDESGAEYGSGSPISDGSVMPTAPRLAPAKKQRLEESDRERLWWAHSRRLDSHEVTMKKAMAVYFLEQGDRVLAAFDKITAGRTVVSALRASLLQRADVPGGERTNEIFNKTAENNQLKKDLRPVIVRIMEQSAAAAQEEFSLNVAFDVTNPMVSKIVAAAENRIVKINDTTYNAIKRLLQNAIDDGESLDSVARRIRDLFDGFSKTRATVVARTETNGIMNGAADATYRMAGIDKKEWLATLDDVTRDSHAEADGQIVPMSSPFEVGGEALAFPGDQAGSPGNTINCRCAMAPVIE